MQRIISKLTFSPSQKVFTQVRICPLHEKQYLLKSGYVKTIHAITCHNCILIETEERWPTKAEVKGSDVKYICGMPPLSDTAGPNVPEDLQNLYNQGKYTHVAKSDLKAHLLSYTGIQFPSQSVTDYLLMDHLLSGLNMLTFDGRDEKKPMGVIAGSYPAFKGNIAMY